MAVCDTRRQAPGKINLQGASSLLLEKAGDIFGEFLNGLKEEALWDELLQRKGHLTLIKEVGVMLEALWRHWEKNKSSE
ncbi:hypothetical protein OCU04_003180 [Sclerotinia nivalis]|uniref:Uncharacterized protein n=1 Tax=Sclerotinia nivalis TaxID=352851 RepID=A0A9X0AV56_9HELO|nr:hypothetical protein OCU04_003180 [Sclerotinia nivalis]